MTINEFISKYPKVEFLLYDNPLPSAGFFKDPGFRLVISGHGNTYEEAVDNLKLKLEVS